MKRTPIAALAALLLLTSCRTAAPDNKAGLRQQRDAIQARLALPSEADDQDTAPFVSLNSELGEQAHSLQFYDTLPVGSPARVFLARQLVREFVAERRYSDAVLGWDERYENRLVIPGRSVEGIPDDSSPETGRVFKQPRLLLLADCFEALAGTGNVYEAQELAYRITKIDNSPGTLALLRERATRAGRADLPAMRDRGHSIVVANPVSKLTQFSRDLEDPKLRAEISARAKLLLDDYYGFLFQELNLQPDRLEQFKNLLIRRELAVHDAAETVKIRQDDQGTRGTAVQVASEEGVRAPDAEIASLLGADGYARYVDYNSNFALWSTANQLAAMLRSTPTPLTDSQAVRLVEALKDSRFANSDPEVLNITAGSGQFPGPFPSRPDAGVRARVAGELSDPQNAALHQLAQRQEIDWDETERVEMEPLNPAPQR